MSQWFFSHSSQRSGPLDAAAAIARARNQPNRGDMLSGDRNF